MPIISCLIFLLVIFSGSVFCIACFNKKFEQVLPITCISIVVISFILGLIKLLKYSWIVICILSVVLYALAIIKIIKDNSLNSLINNFFTVGFVVFIVLTVVIFLSVYNKYFDATDEFSHWGDIVKTMIQIGDFGTNPNSGSLFKSYPPGVSLFQYFVVSLNSFISKEGFSEWLCYFSYDVLGISLFMPLCANLSFKKILSPISLITTIFLVPLEFYLFSYHGLYVDQFLGYLIAAGALNIVWGEEGLFKDLTIYSILIMLILAKDAGLLFAILLALTYVLTNRKLKNAIISIICIAVPKLLWTINCGINHVEKEFSNPFDFKSLILVLLGKEDSYRKKVLTNFIERMTLGGIELGETTVFINYIVLLVVSIIAVCIICSFIKKDNAKIASYFLIVNTLVFIIGTCISYMYKFSEAEALALASFDRYLAIVFLSIWLFICISIVLIGNDSNNYLLVCGLLICFVFINTPTEAAVSLVTNSYAKISRENRSQYTQIIDKIENNVNDDEEVIFIVGETLDRDRLALRYCLKPIQIDSYLVIDETLYELDSEEQIINLAEYVNDKYLALYNVDDIFIELYSETFSNPEEVGQNCLYKLNSDGLLQIVE